MNNSKENKLIKSLEQKIKVQQDKLEKLQKENKVEPKSDLVNSVQKAYEIVRVQGIILGLMDALLEALKIL